jgi:coproporphyrinogen III oxidase
LDHFKRPALAGPLAGADPSAGFKATGVSLVIHPRSPHIPTIHMNIRYFESGDRWWFGGGIDLTPYYPVFEQVKAFHLGLKSVCDAHRQPYEEYKRICDEYFTLKHRKEMRGVGGIFFDHLKEDKFPKAAIFDFVIALGMHFTELYEPFFLGANIDRPWTDAQREYQLWRRSRYVEFNLLWDRGTKFGIESEGRTESILMSLPTIAKWYYDYYPTEGTVEGIVNRFYLQPKDWVNLDKSSLPTPTVFTSDFANTSYGTSKISKAYYAFGGFLVGVVLASVATVTVLRSKSK